MRIGAVDVLFMHAGEQRMTRPYTSIGKHALVE